MATWAASHRARRRRALPNFERGAGRGIARIDGSPDQGRRTSRTGDDDQSGADSQLRPEWLGRRSGRSRGPCATNDNPDDRREGGQRSPRSRRAGESGCGAKPRSWPSTPPHGLWKAPGYRRFLEPTGHSSAGSHRFVTCARSPAHPWDRSCPSRCAAPRGRAGATDETRRTSKPAARSRHANGRW